MAAWIAACNSSMVLSLDDDVEAELDESPAVETRKWPLFVGDVLMDAGAENKSPLRAFIRSLDPLINVLLFSFEPIKEEEKEYEEVCLLFLNCVPFPLFWNNIFMYFLTAWLRSKLISFFFCSCGCCCFSCSRSLPSNPFLHFDKPKRENDFIVLALTWFSPSSLSALSLGLVFLASVLLLLLFVVGRGVGWSGNTSFTGRANPSLYELVEVRGETGRWERRWRGRRWPWKKISSAGDKSTANGSVCW